MNDLTSTPLCRARILPLLSEISSALTEHQDLAVIMDLIVSILVEHLPGVKRIVLSILNRASGSISIESAWGLSDEEKNRGVYRVGEGITGRVIQTGVSMIIPDLSKEPHFLNRTRSLQSEQTAGMALISIPIRTSLEILGSISIYRAANNSEAINSRTSGAATCINFNNPSLQQNAELLSIIAAMIAQAVELQRARKEETTLLLQENHRLQAQLAARYHPSQIVGNSRPMQDLFAMMEKVYNKPTPILILGETGAGKELVAQALHFNSPRHQGPFVRFNCAALPEQLAESELFGHEKGAFTGAIQQRKGRFEEAHTGTLFLDEIGELSLPVQAKLLRVLQSHQFERLGSSQTLLVDVRFIAATNRNLPEMIKKGEFREDLFYRLNVFPLQIPSLRERGSDIMLLVDYFVEKYSQAHKVTIKRVSSPAIEALMAYHWPGNVRELENVIERAVILSDDEVIHAYHLPPSLQTADTSNTQFQGKLENKLDQVERETIVEAIKACKGNMAQASRMLGFTERVMSLRMRKHNIDWRLYRGNSELLGNK